MVILIDAYNVLKQSVDNFITQKQRDMFVAELARYAKNKNHSLIVVFDGGLGNYPEKISFKSCVVIYSGRNQSADDVIKTYLDTCHSDNTLLVSLDHELYSYAHKRNIPSIEPLDFMFQVKNGKEKLANLLKNTTGLQKRRGHASNREVDELFAQANIDMLYKDEDVSPAALIKKAGNMRSKREKILEKIVKKL